MFKDFREFLIRGNLVDLAVAVVIGTAFAVVVKPLVDNIVMPILATLFGKPDFSALTFKIHNSVFHYGQFLTDLLIFALVALVVFFFVVKPTAAILRRVSKEKDALPDPGEELLNDIKRLLEEQNTLLRK
jgi:large conductance mechanosensitive channel